MYVYGAFVFMSVGCDCVGVCGNVCCVATIVKDNGFFVCFVFSPLGHQLHGLYCHIT